VEEILCGPSPADLPEDPAARKRQAKMNRHELTTMIDSIMTTKEEDEREDQAHQRAVGNRRIAHLI